MTINFNKLKAACKQGQLTVVQQLIKNGADISHNQYEVVKTALEYGRMNVVNYLREIDKNVDNIVQEHSYYDAATKGYLNIIKDSMDSKSRDQNYKNTIFQIAIDYDRFNIIKYFIEQNLTDKYTLDRSLSTASSKGNLKTVKYLIENGANVHGTDGEDWPVILAVRDRRIKVVQYLVEHGANINAKNNLALKCANKNNDKLMLDYIKSVIGGETND